MKSNIALIGFMGAGKSDVGKLLAAKLDMQFIETDSLIEKRMGKKIAEIFRDEGEPFFRRLENEVTMEASNEERAVISCGGGVVMDKLNIDSLRKNSLIIYLQVRPDIILKRVGQSMGTRPLLDVIEPADAVNNLLTVRKPLYAQAADIVIDTSDMMCVDAVVSAIIAKINKHESINLKK